MDTIKGVLDQYNKSTEQLKGKVGGPSKSELEKNNKLKEKALKMQDDIINHKIK